MTRHAPPYRRAARSLAAALAALCWTVLSATAALARSSHDSGTSGSDLILPIAVLATASAAAAYTYTKRKRRINTRTTPGSSRHQRPAAAPPAEEPKGHDDEPTDDT
ncbi:hypothetical protein [Streptomyces sp. NPDC050485]|uniref:hypothetical protein n=1 Tax=Streptomyces sp. NPDC050485 TaxID=3365617 RepID=UPI0037A9A25E